MEMPDEFSEANGWRDVGSLERGTAVFTYRRWLAGDPGPMSYGNAPSVATEIIYPTVYVDWEVMRYLLGIPPGFPLWYAPERPALTVGPIGRLIQSTQCQCGHDELRHIILLDECLAGCDCPRFRLRTPTELRSGWRARLRRLIRRGQS